MHPNQNYFWPAGGVMLYEGKAAFIRKPLPNIMADTPGRPQEEDGASHKRHNETSCQHHTRSPEGPTVGCQLAARAGAHYAHVQVHPFILGGNGLQSLAPIGYLHCRLK